MAHVPMEIRTLNSDEVQLLRSMTQMFGEAFDDRENYAEHPPSEDYLRKLLARDSFIALVAIEAGDVIGGVVAYELVKFEQERSEIYIYDLAVAATRRRLGVATALIEQLKELARERGAYVIYVQADTEVEDEPAIALYDKLGIREEVLHFDIAVDQALKF